MPQLIDRQYPFATQLKQFRLGMRAIREGWLSVEDERDLANQGLILVEQGQLSIRQTLVLLKTICIAERRIMDAWYASLKAESLERT